VACLAGTGHAAKFFIWFIFLLPALPTAAVLSWLLGKYSWLWLYLAFLLPFFLMLGYQSITRYSIPILGLGLVAFVFILDAYPKLNRWIGMVILPLFIFSAVHGSLNKNVTLSKVRELLRLSAESCTVETCYNYLGHSHGSLELMRWWRRQKTNGTRLMYHTKGWIFTYPLWNSRFTNRLDYIPDVSNQEEWRQSTAEADWLLVSKESLEEEWTDRLPEFQKVYDGDQKFVVYRRAD
jgi:hypothetical protein